jgi:hypothetical protein
VHQLSVRNAQQKPKVCANGVDAVDSRAKAPKGYTWLNCRIARHDLPEVRRGVPAQVGQVTDPAVHCGGIIAAMTADHTTECETVDIVINSATETPAVDAFALSLIKAERQIRKLVTHLTYQFPCFGPGDVSSLRQTLVNNRRVYFGGFQDGFDALYPRTIGNLIGQEYKRLDVRMREAIDHRNKIFHGQLTSNKLTRDDLLAYVTDIRAWCSTLATSTLAEFEYDGFGRNSFQKSTTPELWKHFKVQITTIADYDDFVRQHMQR